MNETESREEASLPAPGQASGRRHLMRASALMASGSIVSRLLGFVRMFVLGMVFAGSGTISATAFSAANLLPNSIWLLVGGGTLNAILVPAIVRAATRPDRGSDYISRLMTLVVLCSTVLTVVCMLLVPVLLTITNGSLPPSTFAFAVQLGYWMMPQIIFSALYVMAGQLLNAYDSFGPYQWAPVMNNLVGILGGLLFLLFWGKEPNPAHWTIGMVMMLAALNVGGSVAQVVFLAFYVRKLKLRLRPRWGFRGLGLGKLSKIGGWTLAMLGLAQAGIWASRWSTGRARDAAEHFSHAGRPDLAAQYPSLLAMDWTYAVFMIPQGIIAVTLVTAAFPTISRHAADGDHVGALKRYTDTTRLLAVPMMLCTAVFIVLSGPVMHVIVGGGSPIGARANGWVLIGYMLGLLPFSLSYLLKRVFYAYEDARTPFLMQIPASAVSLIAAAPILMSVDPRWATATAAAVSSLGYLFSWLLGLAFLRRLQNRLGAQTGKGPGTVGVIARLSVASGLAIVVGALLLGVCGDLMWVNRVLTVLLGCVIGAAMSAVFVVVAWLLRVEELQMLMRFVRRRRSSV